jgi:hypothetical protein
MARKCRAQPCMPEDDGSARTPIGFVGAPNARRTLSGRGVIASSAQPRTSACAADANLQPYGFLT